MKLEEEPLNNLKDQLIISDYDKDSFDGEDLCIGVDEAGRGPVLGPMVYSAFFCAIKNESKLKEMGCADSKTLTEKDREKILDKINENNSICGYATKVLSPHTISTSMLRRVKYNLNELSHDTAICLISILANDHKLNIKNVYLDTVGDPNKYEQKLSKLFPNIKIKVSKKADSIYPCVSAASICAKVTRDKFLKSWVHYEGIEQNDFGSGYPGDPVTKRFLDSILNNVFGFVKLVRFSWSTAATKLKKSCVEIEWDDNFEDEGAADNDEPGADKEEQTAKAKPKKAVKSKNSKLGIAVMTEKNNSSILSFFQKSVKRPVNSDSSASIEIISEFMIDHKLKICKSF